MPYEVKAEPAVSLDLAELEQLDEQLPRVALQMMLALREDPWLGDDPRERYNLKILADCRRLKFDVPGWRGKPRFRLVYRNEPSDGSVELIRVWAVGPRRNLIAYTRAAVRASREDVRRRRAGG